MTERQLVVATRSRGKLRELFPLLAPLGLELLTLDAAGIAESPDEDAIECHETFEENALAKARHFARLTALPTVADDSGLEVHALGGAPGVRSKRWSGAAGSDQQLVERRNREKLLVELGASEAREARFVCVAAYVNGVEEYVYRGETTGRILHEERGSGGFGYDSLFLSSDLGISMAECGAEEKERVSHRGRAFAGLREYLAARSVRG